MRQAFYGLKLETLNNYLVINQIVECFLLRQL